MAIGMYIVTRRYVISFLQVLAAANAPCFYFFWPQGGILCVFNTLCSKVLHLFSTNRFHFCHFLFNIIKKKVFLLWIVKFSIYFLYIKNEWMNKCPNSDVHSG